MGRRSTSATGARRSSSTPSHSETSGVWELTGFPGGPFTLHGRADRIERRVDGSIGILDYKTGYSPKRGDIDAGYSPQLLVEALMAEAGGFPDIPAGTVAELIYWELPGGFEPGREVPAVTKELRGVLREALGGLRNLIACYDEPDRPYLSRPHPDAAPRFSDYAQLARLAEWEAAGDGG